ncbi:aminotransferase class V-fold PLP-dependent enzyme [Anaerobutyricum hallii]|uniref:aminotransferase class V-fold PLP-dependent enzyme n=1 Tax=Anaerobutyricum hallii TaxID=39488 RepID=UPI00399C57F8
MIYFDNAATTLHKPHEVIEAVVHAMTTAGNASRGTHTVSLAASRTVYETRKKIADFFHCSRADHVIFTSNSTEALNIAICGTLGKGDHIISTDLEHNSVLRPLYHLEEQGASLTFLSANKKGCIDYDDFKRSIKPNTKAIVCTHASNLTGNVLDIERIGRIAKAHNLLFIVDASQSAGCIEINMETMNIDILCFTGHKGLLGPQGTGGLCIHESVEIRPFKHGGSGIHSYEKGQPQAYPARLEAGTLNSHGIAGLCAAINYINTITIPVIAKKEQELLWHFYKGICNIPEIHIYGDFDTKERAAILSLNIEGYDSGTVSDLLSQEYDIATRPGAHCAPRMHQALGTTETGAVRFSFSSFNTMEEVETAIQALKELVE